MKTPKKYGEGSIALSIIFLVFVRPSSIAPSLVFGLGDNGGILLGLGELGGALLGLGEHGGAFLGLGELGGAVLGLSEHGGALLGLGNPLGPVPLRDHVELVLLGDLVELGLREVVEIFHRLKVGV